MAAATLVGVCLCCRMYSELHSMTFNNWCKIQYYYYYYYCCYYHRTKRAW